MHSFNILFVTFFLSSWLLISCAEPALTLTEPDDDELLEFTDRDDTYYFRTGAGIYELQFYSEEILEVGFLPSGSESEKAAIRKMEEEQSGPDRDDGADEPAEPPEKQEKIRYQSHAVVMEPRHPAVQVEQDDERIQLHTSGVSVIYHIPDARFSFYYDDDRIPTFVRGGAVIPLADLVQSTEDYSVEHLTLKYFFDAAASGYETRIYHDDGLTRDAFGRDMYEKLLIGVEPEAGDEGTGRQVTITFETETGDAFSDEDGFSEISLHAANFPADPDSVALNGEETGFSYDPESKLLEISTFLLESGRNVLTLKF